MNITKEGVAKLYVATFNRAADSSGLNYWLNNSNLTSLEDVSDSFFEQPEIKLKYPNSINDVEFINNTYQNLFNRQADKEGLAYWLNDLQNGTVPRSEFILALINGAKDNELGKDITILNNKTSIALYFANLGLNDITLAKKIIEVITAENSSVESAEKLIYGEDTSLKKFTTNKDDLILDSKDNSTYSADNSTFQASDILLDKNSSDSDVLNLKLSSNSQAAMVIGIESINIELDSISIIEIKANNFGKSIMNIFSNTLGFSGETKISSIGSDMSIKVGENIDTLYLTGDDTNSKTTLNINKDLNLKSEGITNLVIQGEIKDEGLTKSKVSLIHDKTSIKYIEAYGSNDMIIYGSLNDVKDITFKNSKVDGRFILETSDAVINGGEFVDLSNATEHAELLLSNNTNSEQKIIVANNANITIGKSTTNKIVISGNSPDVIQNVNITSNVDVNELNLSANKLNGSMKIDKNVTINKLEIENNVFSISGESNIIINSVNAQEINNSKLIGNTTIADTSSKITIQGSIGVNNITLNDFTSSVICQNANDKITSKITNENTLIAVMNGGNDEIVTTENLNGSKSILNLGNGDDIINFGGTEITTGNAINITINGEAGNDVLKVLQGSNFSEAVTFDILNMEIIELTGTSADKTTKFAFKDLSNKVITLKGSQVNDDKVEVIGSDNDDVMDISKITCDNSLEKLIFDAGAGNDTINGGNGRSYIIGGAGNDTIDLGTDTDGSQSMDTVHFKDRATNGVDTIKNFQAGDGADVLQISKDDTTAGTASGAAAVFATSTQGLATGGSSGNDNAFNLSATSTSDNDVIELTTTLDDDITLSATSANIGNDLLQALSSDDTAASGITVTTDNDKVYLAVYQGNNAYLYHLIDTADAAGGDADTIVAADGITLVGVFEGVTTGGFNNGDFSIN